MSMRKIQDQAYDWSSILKLQDQYSREQDQRRKQQQRLHQKLYKYLSQQRRQQLEQLISQQKQRKSGGQLEEKKIIQYSTEKQKIIVQKQEQEKKKWQIMRQNFSNDNYHSSLDRKKRQLQQAIQEKKRLSERFKKLSTEMSQQKQHEKRSYSLKQHQLALAYDQQLAEQNRRKLLTKQEDIKLCQLSKKISQAKQHERIQNLNRIRFGYGQNEEVYNILNEEQQRKNSQINRFISKLANSQKNITLADNDEHVSEEERARMRKYVSNFNREQFEQKQYRKKLALIEQTLQQKQKHQRLNQTIESQRQYESRIKEKQRKQLQSELEKQIYEFELNKLRNKQMNPEEYKINSSLYKSQRVHSGSMLPGVAYDSQLDKQQRLIQKFLSGNKDKSTQKKKVYVDYKAYDTIV